MAHADWGYWDSGGPVFARDLTAPGHRYFALGIQVAGAPIPSAGDKCVAGAACSFLFNRWSEIEGQLGLGTLNPNTTQ